MTDTSNNAATEIAPAPMGEESLPLTAKRPRRAKFRTFEDAQRERALYQAAGYQTDIVTTTRWKCGQEVQEYVLTLDTYSEYLYVAVGGEGGMAWLASHGQASLPRTWYFMEQFGPTAIYALPNGCLPLKNTSYFWGGDRRCHYARQFQRRLAAAIADGSGQGEWLARRVQSPVH